MMLNIKEVLMDSPFLAIFVVFWVGVIASFSSCTIVRMPVLLSCVAAASDSKKKSVLYMGKDRLRFTADNSFVVHNDNALQMLAECKWFDGELLVPLKYFTELLNHHTSYSFIYNNNTDL